MTPTDAAELTQQHETHCLTQLHAIHDRLACLSCHNEDDLPEISELLSDAAWYEAELEAMNPEG